MLKQNGIIKRKEMKKMKKNNAHKIINRVAIILLCLITIGFGTSNGNKLPRWSEMMAPQKYEGANFTFYPSQFVVHYKDGDYSYTILSAEDEAEMKRLIRTLNHAEKTQQADWSTIQRKIPLCNGGNCGDSLIVDVRKDDSLLVSASIGGVRYDLVSYYPTQNPFVWLVLVATTSSVWGSLLVGLWGFWCSRKRLRKKLEVEIPVYSASRNNREEA